jgi:hypothetical protein
MRRFVVAAVIVAVVAALVAGTLVVYALTAPRGLVPVGDGVPPYFALQYLIRGWLPPFVAVALGAAVCALFGLAHQWSITHADRSDD